MRFGLLLYFTCSLHMQAFFFYIFLVHYRKRNKGGRDYEQIVEHV